MKKYFKNQNKVTAESILAKYKDYVWSDYPHFYSQEIQFDKLFDQCSESDQYLDWQSKMVVADKNHSLIRSEVSEIQSNKDEIVIKNSQEEYDKVIKELKTQQLALRVQKIKLQKKKPKTKAQVLEKLINDKKKAKKISEDSANESRARQNARCRCNRLYCEC